MNRRAVFGGKWEKGGGGRSRTPTNRNDRRGRCSFGTTVEGSSRGTCDSTPL